MTDEPTQSEIPIGARFSVRKAVEIKTDKGRLLARYHPQFSYSVTSRNVAIVNRIAVEDGSIIVGDELAAVERARRGVEVTASPSKVRGTVRVGRADATNEGET